MQAGTELLTSNSSFFEPLLDSKTAASLLGIHWKTLQALARENKIPAHRIVNLWRFRASELDSWLNSTTLVAANPSAESKETIQ